MNHSLDKASIFLLPDLVAIQRESFRWFLEEGLCEVLECLPHVIDPKGWTYLPKRLFY